MMKVKVWGCRGSLPSPGPEKNKYGGNTSCIQLVHENTCIILDGGSGIQRLGQHISKEFKEIHILLTHLHLDHTMGLGFFLPLYNANIKIHLWGPASVEESLTQRLRRYFSPPLFPVRLSELPVHPKVHEIPAHPFQIDGITIQADFVCHPGPTVGFRITNGNSVMTYMPDHEIPLAAPDFPNNDPEWTSGYELAKESDLLFHDSQYRPGEYQDRIGWGHSSIEDTLEFAKLCKVKHLELFHHDPLHSDEELDNILNKFTYGKDYGFEVGMCEEGKEFNLE